MQNLLNDLKTLLEQDERLVLNGKLVKNKIIELALVFDKDLIKKLISNYTIKNHFFADIDSILVFDKIKFVRFVSNKNFLPNSYTSFKNKIGLIREGDYNDDFITKRNDVVLAWPYKDCYLQGGQTKEDDNRNEFFWNETLAPDQIDRLLEPKCFTNWKLFNKDGEKKITETEKITENSNYIIKGNNLLVLQSLKNEFAGKVKLIYIDPPYNTGNDSFMYNDSFNHSTWLTFMKNRLIVAKDLLKSDGIIFIHIDDIEEAYLKILCDEIFDRENFVNVIAVRSSTPSGTKTAHKTRSIIKQKDLILVYKKSEKIELNPQYTRKEKWDTHFNYFLNKTDKTVSPLIDVLIEKKILDPHSKIKDFDIDNEKHRSFYLQYADFICQTQSHKNTELKQSSRDNLDKVLIIEEGTEKEQMFYNGRQLTPLSKSLNKVLFKGKIVKDFSTLLCDFWNDIDFQNTQNEGEVSLTNGKKPELLLYRIIDMTTKEGDLVLDFFVGSGTTATVAHKMKRRYIGIEQLNYIEDLPLERLKKVINGEQSGISEAVNWQGGGEFVYCELMKWNQVYTEQIEKAKNTEELLKLFHEMQKKAFLDYLVNNKLFEEYLEDFKNLVFADQKKFLIDILDKNQLYLSYSEMEDETFKVSAEDKKLNNKFYNLK